MKKRTSKAIVLGLILMLTVSAMAFLTSCGGSSTLEDYIANNKEEQEQLEEANKASQMEGMSGKVEIQENTILYTFKYDQTFSDEQVKSLNEYFETYMDSAAATFEAIAKEYEEKWFYVKCWGRTHKKTILQGSICCPVLLP